MKILLASSEVYPYSKTGGLADMVGALGRALGRAGHRVGLVTPLYAGVRERFQELEPTGIPLDAAIGVQRVRAEVWMLRAAENLDLYFIDQPDYFQRAALYQRDGMDYPDNAERFIFFSKAVTHLALHLPWKPEIVHCHDWQTGLVPLFLHHQRRAPGWQDTPPTCMTIHNLAYQGVFPASAYLLTNLPWDYFVPSGAEFYGQLNCLKAGISFGDVITTVSPRYAREITTEEFGAGLDGLLRRRQRNLYGILNGVDYEEWSPMSDPYIPHPFSTEELAGKTANKVQLQKRFGLPERPRTPLFGNIGRLVGQKGVDIMLAGLHEALTWDIQFVGIGTGPAEYQRAFQDLGSRFPGKARVEIGFNERSSHQIEAGCDFFLMPSQFEPCGLNQMYSLRYGTVPIVRAVGGLDDTVVDIREDADKANGIKFHQYSSSALAKAIRKALALYAHPGLLEHYRQNAMKADFSWDMTAQEYLRVYQSATGRGDN